MTEIVRTQNEDGTTSYYQGAGNERDMMQVDSNNRGVLMIDGQVAFRGDLTPVVDAINRAASWRETLNPLDGNRQSANVQDNLMEATFNQLRVAPAPTPDAQRAGPRAGPIRQ
jgi:hypothetical protein